jgi:UPF0755 protein
VNGKKARKAKPQRAAGIFGGLKALVSLALVAVGLALMAAIVAIVMISAPGPVAQERSIFIEKGKSAAAISRQLMDDGFFAQDWLFRLAAVFYAGDGGLKAGEYAIPAKASIKQIVDILAAGRAMQHSITIPEGYSSVQVIDALTAEATLTGDAPAPPPEGAVLPDTYLFSRGASRAEVLEKMTAAHTSVIEELWPKRQQGLPFETPQQAVILASIVEKETSVPAERPTVAGLYINRLRRGMKLEADPTIIYGITKGRPLGRQIRRSEIDAGPPQNPWNTYRITGLPPSPIANPGRSSIEAVLNPAATDYLFMVADGSGGHLFAATGEEHARNHAAWREIRARKVAAEKAGAAPP